MTYFKQKKTMHWNDFQLSHTAEVIPMLTKMPDELWNQIM
jgi:hypothetical protein